jgi:predicted GNAT family N-acyltransferase
MAVVSEWRGRGVGGAILQSLLDAARARGYADLKLHAQTHAIGFYARHGFAVAGEEFMEAGIPHREMLLRPPY